VRRVLEARAITHAIVRLASGLVKGLRLHHLAPTALRAARALDEAIGRARFGIYVMARQVHGRFDIGLVRRETDTKVQ